jgi:hypothetical protein
MILTFPAVTASSVDWGLQSNTQSMRSELNGVGQDAALPGDIWTGTDTFTNKFDPEARILRAFLASLRGRSGRFWKSPPGYRRAGTATGSPLVKGAGQSGLSLITDGWTPNQALALTAGDYFQVGNELKMLTAAAAANSSGQATLSFTPPLRAIPGDNAAIIVNSPACVMKLVDDKQARWQAEPTPIHHLSVAYEEALDL